jgi:uncharacterized repeat protein (TIGR01451 family)
MAPATPHRVLSRLATFKEAVVRRFRVTLLSALLTAGLVLVPSAASMVTAASVSAGGFVCSPNGTIAGSPTTTLSAANIDTTTPSNSRLTCLFRGVALPSSFGGPCQYDSAAFRVDFQFRLLLRVNSNTNLLCWGGTITFKTDLGITKTDGSATEVPGTSVTYTITATNNGPSAVSGATVTDTFPASLSNVSWTAVLAGGATGSVAGTGNIAESVGLPVGASITYTAQGSIDPSATAPLANTATIAAPTGTIDTNPANDSATDTDTLTPQYDVSVTKDDAVTTVAPGTTSTYTITVTNNGPSTATNVAVSDPLPAGTTAATWSGSNGSSGSSALADTITTLLPAQSVIYTYAADVDAAASGSIVNTATATGANDTNAANNSATDTDTVNTGPFTMSVRVTYGGAGVAGTLDSVTITDGVTPTTCNNVPEDGNIGCSASFAAGTAVTVSFTSSAVQLFWVCSDGSTDNDTSGPPFDGTCTDTMNTDKEVSIQADFQL